MATLTVYPVSGATVDGWIQKVDSSWATARSAATGDTSGDTDTSTTVVTSSLGAGNYTIRRGFFLFDTSALTSAATIQSAVLSFAGAGAGGFNNDNSTTLEVVSSNPASNTALSTADFDQVGSTSFGNIAFASFDNTVGNYNAITLNASGIAAISKTGITKFGLRTGLDLSNTAPSGGSTVQNRLPTNFSDQTGTDKDPKLVITYTVDTPINADAGSFTLTGQNVSFLRTYVMNADTGVFSLTGQAVSLLKCFMISALTGAFELIGNAIDFIRLWTNDTKPTSSYSNDTKPTSSYTNDTKPSGSWTNDTKP